MRATRDLLRRRIARMRPRAAWLTHIQHTHRQDTLPELGQNIADQATREGVAERFPDAAVQNRIAGDLARLGYDDHLLTELERSRVHTAQEPHAPILSRLPAIPGVGTIRARVLR